MANLISPQLFNIPAFDFYSTSEQYQNFTFTVGRQSEQISRIIGSTLIIKDESGNIKYNLYKQSERYENYKYVYTFPLYSIYPSGQSLLENGHRYTAQLTYRTVDTSGNLKDSPLSNIITFYCYTTPTFNIINIPSGRTITSSSFEFELEYNQIEGEKLNSYSFNLFDTQGVQIASSGVLYTGATESHFMSKYQFSGFYDNTTYKIQVNGITEGNTTIKSELYQFTANYVNPNVFALLELENNCLGGYISIKSNMVDIEATSYPSPPIYIDNKKVDLRGDGYYVDWGQGYVVPEKFTMRVWGQSFNLNKQIVLMLNDANSFNTPNRIELFYRYDNGYFVEAYIYNNIVDTPYYCYSNTIKNVSSSEEIFIWFRKDEDVYELKIEKV